MSLKSCHLISYIIIVKHLIPITHTNTKQTASQLQVTEECNLSLFVKHL